MQTRPIGSAARTAPGYRDAGHDGRLGGMMSVGHRGYSWSSAISGTNGVFLHFGATELYPSSTTHRAHGLQLRCLSE